MQPKKIEIAPTNYLQKVSQYERPVVATTPDVGKGNPTFTRALVSVLKDLGLNVVEVYPSGFWVKRARDFHIRMTQDIKRSKKYTIDSAKHRNSIKTKPLLWEFKDVLSKIVKEYPDAEFLITPQNMLGELVASVSIKGKRFNVIMFLPDAMGKLPSKKEKITPAQRAIHYLVWNRASSEHMIHRLDIQNVQLVELLNPQLAYNILTIETLKERGFKKLFDTEAEKICIIKLSGSGGPPPFVNDIMTALWKHSGVTSIVFPGQEKTGKKLLKSVGDKAAEKIIQSLDEEEFYNVARNLVSDSHLFLTYPSEQCLHIMVLSENGIRVKVLFLPPRGNHEITSLIHYMLIANEQNMLTSICLPNDLEWHSYLHQQLKNAGFSPNLHYQFVTPDQVRREHFNTAPSWQLHEERHNNETPRIPIAHAIQNYILERMER